MTDKQQISALIDGEAVDHAFITELEQDTDAQATWKNYHLIGDTLKGDAPSDSQWDISARVAQALEAEPTYSNVTALQSKLEEQPKKTQSRLTMPAWLSNLTQVGIAACVSLVVILGVQQYSGSDSTQVTADSEQLPVLQTIPFAGSAEPVSLTRDSVKTQLSEAKLAEKHRRVNALMQDYELQLRLNNMAE